MWMKLFFLGTISLNEHYYFRQNTMSYGVCRLWLSLCHWRLFEKSHDKLKHFPSWNLYFPTEEIFELIMTCFKIVVNDIKLALKVNFIFFIAIEKDYRDNANVNKHSFECSTNVVVYKDHTDWGVEVKLEIRKRSLCFHCLVFFQLC